MRAPSDAWLREHFDPDQLGGGRRGIEREALRVDRNGALATTPHPAAIGSALTHPLLTTDYSEALLEFVTPPFATTRETLGCLQELHAFVQQRIGTELLWPASMPCIGDDDEAVPIADYGGSNEGLFRTVYRRGLGHRYGRAMQAIAGVHFNFSPAESIWAALRETDAGAADTNDYRAERFMGLVRNYRRMAWIVAYLFGASPVIARSFVPAGHPRLQPLGETDWYAPYATSLRMSDLGYRNTSQAGPGISANSLADYVAQLRAAVSTPAADFEAIGVEVDGEFRQLNANVLQIENEYYSSIRPKPRDRSARPVDALARDGIEYVELRNLDSDPTLASGLGPTQSCVAEALLLLCLLLESPAIPAAEQAEIDRRELTVAWRGREPGLAVDRNGRRVTIRDWGFEVCDALDAIAAQAKRADMSAALAEARAAFADPELTPSAQLVAAAAARSGGLLEYGLSLAEAHRSTLASFPFPAGREAELERLAGESLASAAALEAAPAEPFARYLARYFGP